VSMEPGSADAKALNDAVGKPIEVLASPDHLPKTKDGTHRVYPRRGSNDHLGDCLDRGT
jgi:hypothetical protein